MKNNRILVTGAFAIFAFATGLLFDGDIGRVWSGISFIPDAHAAVYRKRHYNYHGSYRPNLHHRRYAVHRSIFYYSALPRGCVKVRINGNSYWRCGGRYYERYNGRYAMVYVN
jgi:hypothetical protein